MDELETLEIIGLFNMQEHRESEEFAFEGERRARKGEGIAAEFYRKAAEMESVVVERAKGVRAREIFCVSVISCYFLGKDFDRAESKALEYLDGSITEEGRDKINNLLELIRRERAQMKFDEFNESIRDNRGNVSGCTWSSVLQKIKDHRSNMSEAVDKVLIFDSKTLGVRVEVYDNGRMLFTPFEKSMCGVWGQRAFVCYEVFEADDWEQKPSVVLS